MIKLAVEVIRKSKIGITYFFAEDRAWRVERDLGFGDPRLSPLAPGVVTPALPPARRI